MKWPYEDLLIEIIRAARHFSICTAAAIVVAILFLVASVVFDNQEYMHHILFVFFVFSLLCAIVFQILPTWYPMFCTSYSVQAINRGLVKHRYRRNA